MTTARPQPPPKPRPADAPELRLSVWPTAQRDARTQRRGRYLPESVAHPAKMLPGIAATAIARYTEPGDLVADPMCGIGTTLVEAVHLGRDGLGVEYEERWAAVAAANIAHARRQGATGTAEVIRGDARLLSRLLPPGTPRSWPAARCCCAPAGWRWSPPGPGGSTASWSTCPPPSSPPAPARAWSRSHAA